MTRFRPSSLAELEKLMAWAVAEGTTLAVTGAGTKAALGRVVQAEHGLDTTGLSGIDMYEPEELVMSCGAGTPLAEVERVLHERGQLLAFEPPDYGNILDGEASKQTIGGVFAANLAGPRRLKTGAARDHLLGLQGVTGHGQVMKTGGRVVKNVTGYDLCKLLTGSFGTLAVMSHLTFKVMPAPEEEATLVLRGRELAPVAHALRKAMCTAYEVSSAAIRPGDGFTGYLRLEGASPSVAYRHERLVEAVGGGLDAQKLEHEASQALWRGLRDVEPLTDKGPVLWRISIPPTDLEVLTEGLDGPWLADWAGGLVWYTGGPERPEMPGSGHAMLIRAPEELRAGMEPFQPQPAPLRALTARVKNSFDPKAVLNPGRMYAGI